MHEISVLEKVIRTCEKTAQANDVTHIEAITLSVGELTGYIPYFFTEYFPIITKDNALFDGTELRIKEVRGEGICKDCGAMYGIMKAEGKCPRCGSRDKTIIGGQEFRVEELIV